MIEQLKAQNTVLPKVFEEEKEPQKRIPITEELIELANMQAGLEEERDRLKQSVQSATDLLAPLRSQMQEVIACMKKFHDLENSYIALSQRTYRDIASDMNAVGKEIEQTKGLLAEGTRLAEAGIELPQLASTMEKTYFTRAEEPTMQPERPVVREDAVPRAPEPEKVKEILQTQTEETANTVKDMMREVKEDTTAGAAKTAPDIARFWDAVKDACKQITVINKDEEDMSQILLTRDTAALSPSLHDIVLSSMSDVDVLRITMHDYADGTSALTAELTDTMGLCSMPFTEVFGKQGLKLTAQEELMALMDEARETQIKPEQAYDAPESNFDGLLDELGVE